jgi:hypothetical protein
METFKTNLWEEYLDLINWRCRDGKRYIRKSFITSTLRLTFVHTTELKRMELPCRNNICYKFWLQNLKRQYYQRDLLVNGKIPLNWSLEKEDVKDVMN